MDKLIQWLLACAKPYAETADKTEMMLGAPEIISDTKYHAFLCEKLQGLEEIRRCYLQILSLQREEDMLSTLTGEGLEDYVAEEKMVLKEKITNLAFTLAKALFDGDLEYQRVKAEIVYDSKSQNLGNALICQLKKICAEEKLSHVFDNNIFTVTGRGAYSLLKGEKGIHFAYGEEGKESACILVYPEGEITCGKISDDEIKIDYFHSGGKGGQNVNKVETAIRATHEKTGIVVVCQDERSQLRNKERAIERLKEKVLAFYRAQGEKEMEKARREGENQNRIRLWDFKGKTIKDLRLDLEIPLSSSTALFDKMLFIKAKANLN